MAEVNTEGGGGGAGHGKHQKKRAKKSSTRIDMTPMVDLAFLLLTFFVMTSTFSKPKTMEVNYPADKEDKPQQVKNAITFILSGNDKIYYYEGEFYPPNNDKGKPPTTLTTTNYSKDGLRKVLTENRTHKQTLANIKSLEEKFLRKEIADTALTRMVRDEKGKWESLTVLIKTDDKATFRNVIDIMDELNINQVGKYAVVDMQQGELDLLNAMPK